MLSRRRLLSASAAAFGLGALPALAASGSSSRKFLFLYCRGGWDPSYVFTPMAGTGADVEPDAAEATSNGIRFVDHAERPSVREFFQRYGDRAAVINGMEVQSITHQRCRQLFMTGRSDLDADDWGAILAAGAPGHLVLPHLVLSGPSYASRFADRIVRVGDTGQLPSLLSGEALSHSDMPITPLSTGARSTVDAYLAARVARAQEAAAASGRTQRAAAHEAYGAALADVDVLMEMGDDLDLAVLQQDCTRDIQADFETSFAAMSQGLSRTAMVQYNGWCDQGWDTHQRLYLQSTNFEEVFGHLGALMATLDGWGGSLRDELAVVLWSEMGRHPRLNSWGGKDHWTTTSVMLLGSGIRGGQVIGALDEGAQGRSIDLDSGEPTDSGTHLGPEHLGATLLALADIDPAEFIDGGAPIGAAIS